MSITFTGNSNGALNNEFYGIDNVVVSAKMVTASAPEPMSVALFGSGLCASRFFGAPSLMDKA